MKAFTARVTPVLFSLLTLLCCAIPASVRAADVLSAGDSFTAAITSNGALSTWGKNDTFQLGHSIGLDPVSLPQAVTRLADGVSWIKVSVGGKFTLAQASDGKLYSWGSNTNGELGTGSLTSSPGKLSTVALPDGAIVKDFVAGKNHALALVDYPGKEEGVVLAWGLNTFGQLGQGANDSLTRSTPTEVTVIGAKGKLKFKSIGATDNSSFAIATDGTLWAWGTNGRGELGQGKRINSSNWVSGAPLQVGKAKKWTAVIGGARHVLALQDTKIYAWGDNALGQCARGSTTLIALSPVTIALPRQKGQAVPLVAKLVAGTNNSFAVTTAGRVYGWGFNGRGELGRIPATRGRNIITTPSVMDQEDPGSSKASKRIDLPAISSVAAGDDFTILATATGDYYAYGSNQDGQLGLGTTEATTTNAGRIRRPLVVAPNLAVAASVPVSSTVVSGVPQYGTGTTFGGLSLVVRNTSALTHTNTYRVSFFLSTNATLDAGDRLLVSKVEAAPLAGGASLATKFTALELTVPEVTPGNYYLLSQVVSLDSTGSPLVDAYAPDNGASVAVGIVGPDLTFSGVVSLENTLVEDGSVGFGSVSLTLLNSNLGSVAAGRSIRVDAYLSPDNTIQPSADALLKSIEVPVPAGGLFGGGAMPVDFGTIPVPAQIDGGDYYLIFVANRLGEIDESPATLDTSHLSVRVAAHDLSVVPPLLPAFPLGSASTLDTVIVTVQNLGFKSYSGSYTVELYVSLKSTFDPTATRVGEPQVLNGGLGAQSSRQVFFRNVDLPITTQKNVTFFARVTPDVLIGDRYPNNNVASVSATLEPAVFSIGDFVPLNPSNAESGGSLGAISYRVSNAGPGVLPAGFPVNVEVYLSVNDVLDRAADIRLDRYAYFDGLDAGASVLLPSGSHSLDIPSGTPNGLYYLIFAFNADGDQPIFPSAVASKRVNIGAFDVSVTAPSLISKSLGTNSEVTSISADVTNLIGFDVPAGLQVELYLSKDQAYDNADRLLKTVVTENPVLATETRAVNFDDVIIPDLDSGDYFLITRLVVPPGLVDTNVVNNVGYTAVSLSRPTLIIENFTSPYEVDLDLPNPVLSPVGFSLVNTTAGVVPVGTPLVYETYLSKDKIFDARDIALAFQDSYLDGLAGAGDLIGRSTDIPPFEVPVPDGVVGGTYYLLVVVNREGLAKIDNGSPLVSALEVRLKKRTAPGNGIDYGSVELVGQKKWFVTTDPRATGASAFESPSLVLGDSSSIELLVSGPTALRVPWKLIADGGDALQLSIDGGVVNLIDEFDPVYKLSGPLPDEGLIKVVSGTHKVAFTYAQSTSALSNYARVDLDLPSITTGGDGDWFNDTSPRAQSEAKVAGSYASSPTTLAAGQQASLEVTVQGPAEVAFWWRATGVTKKDTLSFFVDGELAELPTKSMDEAAIPAVISNQPEWRRVVFLIGSGPKVLRWVYAKGSNNADAQGNVDGLVVMSPVPEENSVNRDSIDPVEAAEYSAVPESTVDIAITGAESPVGTYLLDDAEGTSRLPVRVTFTNRGKPYSADPVWSASNLELRLSLDKQWGNSDDITLGNYSRFESLISGDEVTFSTEVNLSFDLPAGTYFLLVRVRAFDSQAAEFTLANNTVALGETGRAYVIKRAPNLVISKLVGLAQKYPYHPEDAVYATYTVANTGLGDVLPSDKFKVRFSLLGALSGTPISDFKSLRTYTDREFSLFLPAARASYPDSASVDAVQFLDIPSERDLLVALGLVPAGSPEDSAIVKIKRDELANYSYAFQIAVDVDNAVVESSETNTFSFAQLFHVIPTTSIENMASFYGSGAFEDFLNEPLVNSAFTAQVFDLSAIPSVENTFTDYAWDYALYRAPLGSPNLLFQEGIQNGVSLVNVPPSGLTEFQTLTFDFNVRSTDAEIEVQATDDSLGGVWNLVYKLTPPYNEIFGPRSLTGYGGLSSSPYILALDGNVSDVQTVHAARITFRDVKSLQSRGAANNPRMRLVVHPALGIFIPPTPALLQGAQVDSTIVLNWTGTLPANSYGVQGAWIIERARDGVNFVNLGSTSGNTYIDSAPGEVSTNTYRVRGISIAGASGTAKVSVAYIRP